MTFVDIIVKMIKHNLWKYRLFFICNCSMTAIFLCFAILLTDSRFMDAQMIDPMISGNIYFPSVLMATLIVLFLPLSYGVFLDLRKRDYGILLSLGMKKKTVFCYLITEGLIVSIAAFLLALLMGTVLSFLFYLVVRNLIGLREIQWGLHVKAYLLTGILYFVVLVATLFILVLKMLRQRIRQLIKTPFQAEKRGVLYKILNRSFPRYMNRNLVRHSFLMRHKREWSICILSGSVIIAVILFLICFSLNLTPALYRDVEVYSPFDMTYAEIWNANQVSPEDIICCLQTNGVSVQSSDSISFMRDSAFNYVSVEEINDKLGCDYKVAEGRFINLFQYDMEDGYQHDVTPTNHIAIKEGQSSKKLEAAESDIRILWNQTQAMADRTLLLSEQDFNRMKNGEDYFEGILHLYRFSDWETSEKGVLEVQKLLKTRNQFSESRQWEVRLSAKILDYKRAKQSGEILLFFVSFVVLLLYAAEYILIHFRIVSEREEDGRAFNVLYSLGIAREELRRFLLFKNKIRFILPVIVGTLLSMLFLHFCMASAYDLGGQSVDLCFVIGSVSACILCLAQIKNSKQRDVPATYQVSESGANDRKSGDIS